MARITSPTYTYDELGRVTTRAINGVPLTLTYDALGRVQQEVNALGTFAYGYDGVSGRIATVTYPNSQSSSYTYFPSAQDHRLQTIHHRYPNGATLSKFDYTYDATGNIVTWRQQADTIAVIWDYGYDGADQLIRATKRDRRTKRGPAALRLRVRSGGQSVVRAGGRGGDGLDLRPAQSAEDAAGRRAAHRRRDGR